MKFSLILRLTDAVLPIGSELKAGVADALEASLRVDAAAIAAHHPVDDALVDVCRRQRRKSGVTATRQGGEVQQHSETYRCRPVWSASPGTPHGTCSGTIQVC